MGLIGHHAVDGVSGGEHRLSPGLHIGMDMGITAGIPVLIHHILSQVPVTGILVVFGLPHGDIVAVSREGNRIAGDLFLTEGDHILQRLPGQIHIGLIHGSIYPDHIIAFCLVGSETDPVSRFILTLKYHKDLVFSLNHTFLSSLFIPQGNTHLCHGNAPPVPLNNHCF